MTVTLGSALTFTKFDGKTFEFKPTQEQVNKKYVIKIKLTDINSFPKSFAYTLNVRIKPPPAADSKNNEGATSSNGNSTSGSTQNTTKTAETINNSYSISIPGINTINHKNTSETIEIYELTAAIRILKATQSGQFLVKIDSAALQKELLQEIRDTDFILTLLTKGKTQIGYNISKIDFEASIIYLQLYFPDPSIISTN